MPNPRRDAEMVDSSVSKTDGLNVREGSTPSLGTEMPESPRVIWYQWIPFFKDPLQTKLFFSGLFFFGVAIVLYSAELTGKFPVLTAIKEDVKEQIALVSPQPSALPSPSLAPGETPALTPSPSTGYQIPVTTLFKIEGNERKEILRMEYSLRAATWKNYLFYVGETVQNSPSPDGSFTGNTSNIYSYNFDTGEKKVIGSTDSFEGVSDMIVVGDKLFVSEGGYFTKEGLLLMDLPPGVAGFTQIADVENAQFFDENGEIWLKGGNGDGCGGYRTFAVLKPNDNSVQEVFKSNEGCMEGDHLLDRDTDGNFIYTVQDSIEYPENPDFGMASLHKSLHFLSYPNLEKKTILDDAAMPKDIIFASYLPLRKQAMLMSKNTLWLVDIETKLLRQLATDKALPNVDSAYGVEKDHTTFCYETYKDGVKVQREINLDTGADKEASLECTQTITDYRAKRYPSINVFNQNRMKRISVPAGYELLYTPSSE